MRTLVFVLGGLLVVMFGVAMYYYGKSQTPVAAPAPAIAPEPSAIDPATLSNAATVDMPGREVVSPPGSVFSNPKPPAWQPDDFEQKLVVSNVEYDHRVLAASSVRGIIQNTSKTTVYTNVVLQVKFFDRYNETIAVKEDRLEEGIFPGSITSIKITTEKPAMANRYDVFVVSADALDAKTVVDF